MKMEKLRGITLICITMIVMWMLLSGGGYGDEKEDKDEGIGRVELQKKKPTVSEMLKSLYSLYTTTPVTTTYYHKLKSMVSQAYAFVFPPNLDFRGSKEGAEEAEGGGEKVKEAVSKSLEKSKETMEDSAKSAAEMAAETMHKAKEKLKKTLSQKREESNPEL